MAQDTRRPWRCLVRERHRIRKGPAFCSFLRLVGCGNLSFQLAVKPIHRAPRAINLVLAFNQAVPFVWVLVHIHRAARFLQGPALPSPSDPNILRSPQKQKTTSCTNSDHAKLSDRFFLSLFLE